MVTKKLEQGRSLQHLNLQEAIDLYRSEFQSKQHEQFFEAFNRHAYMEKAMGYEHASAGIIFTGSLVADRNIKVALIADKIREKPHLGREAVHSLAIYLEMESSSNELPQDRHLSRSSVFDDTFATASGKRVKLQEDTPYAAEISGKAVGASIIGFCAVSADAVKNSCLVNAVVNDQLLDGYAMMLKARLHDQLIDIRK